MRNVSKKMLLLTTIVALYITIPVYSMAPHTKSEKNFIDLVRGLNFDADMFLKRLVTEKVFAIPYYSKLMPKTLSSIMEILKEHLPNEFGAIKSIYLNDCNLRTIRPVLYILKTLSKLWYLNLQGNDFDNDEKAEIIKTFPNATVYF